MANISFGLETNKNAQNAGYDLFKSSLGETLGAVAEDAWIYNPVSSIYRLSVLESTRNENTGEPLISREELNKKYSNLGLFFEQDEKQSTVDILVERKVNERQRQNIIQKGPKSIWVSGLKLGTSFAVSALDPINIATAFIPVVGQAKFASMVAKSGFTKARFAKGLVEGTVGTALVEPIVYTAAQREQADYTMLDSFLAISFGTVLGGGLHVGAGRLKDFRTKRNFLKRIEEARKIGDIKDGETPEFNLYKEYYPENSRIMKELEEIDPALRRLLLQKALGDLTTESPVNVKDIADTDPKLRNSQIDQKIIEDYRKQINEESVENYKQKIEVQKKIQSLEKRDPKRKLKYIKTLPELKKLRQKLKELEAKEKNLVEQLTNETKLIDEKIGPIKKQIINEDQGRRSIKTFDQRELERFDEIKNSKPIEQKTFDKENLDLEEQLNNIKSRQKNLDIEESEELINSRKEVEEFNQRRNEIRQAIKDGINCINNR
jgi:hypothetical protein